MKSLTKRIATVGITAAYALTLYAGGIKAFSGHTAFAQTEYEKTIASTYFYDGLTDAEGKEYTLAKKFYEACDKMLKDGDFIDGKVEYSRNDNGLATSDEIKKWVEDGDLTIPKAFSAGRDAFLTDHPELFYIDFYKMTISAARSRAGVYSAYIDSGREANLYYDSGFTSASDVNEAISEYNAKINEIASEAIAYANADKFGTAREVLMARYVNSYLAGNVEYDYGALNDYLETGVETSSAASIHTAYGALVINKAVCDGFSRAYKSVMDKLGIPCLVINGYSVARNSKGERVDKGENHAWNYIWLADPVDESEPEAAAFAVIAEEDDTTVDGGRWYSLDVTWNSSSVNKNKYMIMGEYNEKANHITDGVISSSGYELKYPEISKYNYGCTSKSNGITYSIEYMENGEIDQNGQPVYVTVETVSYNGKSPMKLYEEDNLHLAVRYAYYKTGETELTWTPWSSITTMIEMEMFPAINDDGYQASFPGNASNLYAQYAIMEEGPDIDYHPDKPDIHFGFNLYYSENDVDPGEKMSAISDLIENEIFGTYTAAPYVVSSNPSHQQGLTINDGMLDRNSEKVIMAEKYAQIYEVTYDEDLQILDKSQPIGVSFIAKHSKNIYEYAKFLPLDESGTMVELVGSRTLRFKFMPSLMYEHNMETYNFYFSNVGSSEEKQRPLYDENGNKQYDEDCNLITETYTSNKTPNHLSHCFSRDYYACPKVFNYDGRLYVDCCAQPTLLDNSDLSAMDFKDEEGNSTFSEQERSQMMLVVNNVSDKTEDDMFDKIDSELGVKKDEIKTSETYDINLQICGKYPKIPDGSYVKIALGFPEGYGPDMEGVTFKLYHRKHIKETDTYIIEEVPCVVTKLGIVATVTSFSPYMVAVLDSDTVASQDKTVYASIEGKGGKLTNEDGQIRTLKQGESYTYTIQPDEGYKIFSVQLNGVDVSNRIVDGKLTVTYDELSDNNEVEIRYISEEAAQRYEEKEMEFTEPVRVVQEAVQSPGFFKPDQDASVPNNPGSGEENPDPDNPGGGEENPDPDNPGGGEENPDPDNPGGGEENPDGDNNQGSVKPGGDTDIGQGSDDNNVLLIVGIVIASVAIVTVAVAVPVLIIRKKNK